MENVMPPPHSDPAHSDPVPLRGAQQFMTVDAFEVTVTEGERSAVVIKDHSGPLPPQGRTLPEHAAAMERERAWLGRAAGVSGIVRLVDDPDRIVTRFAGSQTLRSRCPDPIVAVAVLGSVATTISELGELGLVHGSVAPEHIIIGTDGKATLCSPNTGSDPLDDLVELGRCIEHATDHFADAPENIHEWLLIARRLQDGDPSVGAHRAATLLRALAEPHRAHSTSRRRTKLALAVSVAAACLVAGTAAVGSPDADPITGPEVVIDGQRVRVGRSGQLALVQPSDGCTSSKVYLMDPDSSRVWVFTTIRSGRRGAPVAIVPGATQLALESRDGCGRVVATGPAGSVTLP